MNRPKILLAALMVAALLGGLVVGTVQAQGPAVAVRIYPSRYSTGARLKVNDQDNYSYWYWDVEYRSKSGGDWGPWSHYIYAFIEWDYDWLCAEYYTIPKALSSFGEHGQFRVTEYSNGSYNTVYDCSEEAAMTYNGFTASQQTTVELTNGQYDSLYFKYDNYAP